MSTNGIGFEFDAARRTADATYRKIALKVVPLTIIAYVIAYIDRVNVGFAKLQFMQQFNFTEAVYGLGAGLFFIGYMLFEVPSNLYLEKVGARASLTRIMILWGLVSAAMAFISTSTQFYVMRFLLGAAEAGLFPGIILYLSYWFPPERRGRMTSLFAMGGALSGIIGSPLSGWILTLPRVLGLAPWQLLFIYEGLPAVLLGVFTYFYMDDRPEKVAWLSDAEKQMVLRNLQEQAAAADGPRGSLGQALRDPIVYVAAIAYIAVIAGTSSTGLWAPTVLKRIGAGASTIGLLTALPFILAAISVYVIASSSDNRLERRWHFAGSIAAAGISFTLLGLASHSIAATVLLFAVAASGSWAALTVFWTIPPAYLSKRAKAGGIAFISSIGGLGGFIAPNVVGWGATRTGSVYVGLAAIGAVLVLSALLLLIGIRGGRLTERRTAQDHPA